MSIRHVLTEVFLWLGIALLLLAAAGVVTLRDAFDRLHLSGLAAVGALCVALAIVIEKSFSLVGDEALLTAVFLVVVSPVATHAIGRAIRIAERDDWRLGDDEHVAMEEHEP
jgi:multicomponent Na+:H+ antiporter subunit G